MNILVVILGSIGGAFLLLFGVWLYLKKVVTLWANVRSKKDDKAIGIL
jgi:esterase/lipase